MTQATTLEGIVRAGLCAGCGICESLAGRDRVEMVHVDPGRVRPKVKAPLDPATEARIVAVCPGAHVDGAMHYDGPYPGIVDTVVGPTIACYQGHATDEEVRFKAAAGGGLTTLGRYLLETGAVERVLHVTASREAPMRSHHHVSFDRATMLAGAGSRYGPVAPLVDVMALLDEGRRFAFIGKPCDVNAMRNLARIDARVDALVPYMLTISCGGVADAVCTHGFLARHGLEEKELVELRYRGHGWPGDHYARARDGREAREWYMEVIYERPRSYQFRCKLCPDHTGEQADVSVMDPWPKGYPGGRGARRVPVPDPHREGRRPGARGGARRILPLGAVRCGLRAPDPAPPAGQETRHPDPPPRHAPRGRAPAAFPQHPPRARGAGRQIPCSTGAASWAPGAASAPATPARRCPEGAPDRA